MIGKVLGAVGAAGVLAAGVAAARIRHKEIVVTKPVDKSSAMPVAPSS